MTEIILSGCGGRMGHYIAAAAETDDNIRISSGIDIYAENCMGFPTFKSFEEPGITGDVIIDFSNPSCFSGLIKFALSNKIPVVICTTGLTEDMIDTLKDASKTIPVFFSANMSIGVNLITELSKTAAKVLGKSFDIEIVEAHHNQKLDAPSGTALMIADGINSVLDETYEYEYDRHSKREKRKTNEIGISSIRGGTIVGEHEVIFAGHDEIIKISHSARSRELFAAGAVNAAVFIKDKTPGMYSMTDIINA